MFQRETPSMHTNIFLMLKQRLLLLLKNNNYLIKNNYIIIIRFFQFVSLKTKKNLDKSNSIVLSEIDD